MFKIKLAGEELIYEKKPNFEINLTKSTYYLSIELTINEESEILFEFNTESKVNLSIDVLKDSKMYFIKQNQKTKFQTKINLKSELELYNLNDNETISSNTIINLDSKNAKINYILKTVSKGVEKHSLSIYHNSINTTSNIITNGLNINDGRLSFIVSTYIKNKMTGCFANQQNRIINLTSNNCKIQPNLLIDEQDVEANHSALIGGFRDEEMFYLKRLGINHDDALKLLISGFLLNKVDKNLIEQLFSKYWR